MSRRILALLSWEALPLILPAVFFLFLLCLNQAYMLPLLDLKNWAKILPAFALITFFNIRLLYNSRPSREDRSIFPLRFGPYTFKRILYIATAGIFIFFTLFALMLAPAGLLFFEYP